VPHQLSYQYINHSYYFGCYSYRNIIILNFANKLLKMNLLILEEYNNHILIIKVYLYFLKLKTILLILKAKQVKILSVQKP
jgi:hypothetical protein